MNILFHIPQYVDTQRSGGEKTAQDYAEALKERGWGVTILTVLPNKLNDLNEIPIFQEHPTITKDCYQWADIVFSHLTTTGNARNLCRKYNKPLIAYEHNTNMDVNAMRSDIVLFNSHWVRNQCEARHEYKGLKAVCRPLINTDFLECEGEYITLINLNPNKGGYILREIAERMPEQKFLGVVGGYGEQVTLQPNNVKILENQENIVDVFKQTKILIMPSLYESYGRTAVESLLCGLPVIASKSGEGLSEALQEGGVFIPQRDNINAWVVSINMVLNSYNHFRELALKERERIQRQADLDINTFISLAKNVILQYENSTNQRP